MDAVTQPDFRREFLAASSPAERGTLCQQFLGKFMPSDATGVTWLAYNFSRVNFNIGIVETTPRCAGARLLIVRAESVIHTSRHASISEAVRAMNIFDWRRVRE